MKRALIWILGLIAASLIGLFAWGYAPDTDPAEMRAKYANAASRFVEVEPGLKVHVRLEGNATAPTLLLLHGSNSSLQTWEPWVTRLGKDYRIVSLDLTGHGLTGPHPKRDYNVATTVGVVDAVMTKLGINSFALAGNSMGGWVSWNYALAHPDKVSALILVDAAGAPDSEPTALPIGFRLARSPAVRPILKVFTPRAVIAKSIDQTMSVKAPMTEAAIDRYWELLRYPGNRQATGDRGDVKRTPATADQMKRLTMPTLVMWGAEDKLIPVRAADWFAREIPGAQKIVYPKVGHIPMEEVPDQSASDVRAFLKGANT
jgi:pimeloyl-ACP methyl ester carboxylesterase